MDTVLFCFFLLGLSSPLNTNSMDVSRGREREGVANHKPATFMLNSIKKPTKVNRPYCGPGNHRALCITSNRPPISHVVCVYKKNLVVIIKIVTKHKVCVVFIGGLFESLSGCYFSFSLFLCCFIFSWGRECPVIHPHSLFNLSAPAVSGRSHRVRRK